MQKNLPAGALGTGKPAAGDDGGPAALPYIALALGAVAMGASPAFVRLADVGPFASAFWRMALSLPMLWAWLVWEKARLGTAYAAPAFARDWKAIAALGFFFAGDLFFWHLSIVNTTIANATLLATTTPIIVTLGAWLVLKEYIAPRVLAGVLLGIAGAAMLVGTNARFAPDRVFGDLCGIITACFFGSYFLTMAHARRRLTAAQLMFYPAVVTSVLLLAVTLLLEDQLFPQSLEGLAVLAALAFVSQLGGQGLLAYALGHLPAIFSSLVLFLEAIAAAGLAWILFSEHLSLWQVWGGMLILGGIYAARPLRQSRLRAKEKEA